MRCGWSGNAVTSPFLTSSRKVKTCSAALSGFRSEATTHATCSTCCFVVGAMVLPHVVDECRRCELRHGCVGVYQVAQVLRRRRPTLRTGAKENHRALTQPFAGKLPCCKELTTTYLFRLELGLLRNKRGRRVPPPRPNLCRERRIPDAVVTMTLHTGGYCSLRLAWIS